MVLHVPGWVSDQHSKQRFQLKCGKGFKTGKKTSRILEKNKTAKGTKSAS